jgi:hypothetical protein
LRIDAAGTNRVIEDFWLTSKSLMNLAHYRGALGRHAPSFFIHGSSPLSRNFDH